MEKIISQIDLYFIFNIGISFYFLYLFVKKSDNFNYENDEEIEDEEEPDNISLFVSILVGIFFVSFLILIKKEIWDKNVSIETIILYLSYDIFISIVILINYILKRKRSERDDRQVKTISKMDKDIKKELFHDNKKSFDYLLLIINIIILVIVLLDIFKVIHLSLLNLVIILIFYFGYRMIIRYLKR